MSDGNRKLWLVKLQRDNDIVRADDYSIDMSGALLLTNGDMISRELVVAYASHEWYQVGPAPQEAYDAFASGDDEDAVEA